MTLIFNNGFGIQPSSGGGGGGSTTVTVPNITVVGHPTYSNGVLSNITTSNYGTIPIPPNITSFEMQFTFTTGADITNAHAIFGQTSSNYQTPQLEIEEGKCHIIIAQSGGSSWVVWIGADVKINTNYTVNISWDGNKVTGILTEEGQAPVNMEVDSTHTDIISSVYWSQKAKIGGDQNTYAFNGSIDLANSYIKINGSDWWTGTKQIPLQEFIDSQVTK